MSFPGWCWHCGSKLKPTFATIEVAGASYRVHLVCKDDALRFHAPQAPIRYAIERRSPRENFEWKDAYES